MQRRPEKGALSPLGRRTAVAARLRPRGLRGADLNSAGGRKVYLSTPARPSRFLLQHHPRFLRRTRQRQERGTCARIPSLGLAFKSAPPSPRPQHTHRRTVLRLLSSRDCASLFQTRVRVEFHLLCAEFIRFPQVPFSTPRVVTFYGRGRVALLIKRRYVLPCRAQCFELFCARSAGCFFAAALSPC